MLIRFALGELLLGALLVHHDGSQAQIAAAQQRASRIERELGTLRDEGRQHPAWMISEYDLAQNQELASIEHHIEVADTAVVQTNKDLGQVEVTLASQASKADVWDSLLSVGVTACIGMAFWSRVGAAKEENDK